MNSFINLWKHCITGSSKMHTNTHVLSINIFQKLLTYIEVPDIVQALLTVLQLLDQKPNVKFSCRANGSPAPVISWHFTNISSVVTFINTTRTITVPLLSYFCKQMSYVGVQAHHWMDTFEGPFWITLSVVKRWHTKLPGNY